MCNPAAAYAAAAVIGGAMAYKGTQDQKAEYNRARREQEAHNAAQRQMALNQRADDLQFSEEKKKSVLDEAEQVAPTRVDKIQAAEDKQTESNINAMKQANLLGDDSVEQGSAGKQSNEYLKARAEAAGKQTEQAIKLARLFGAQGAGHDAVANQALGAIDFRLDQQAIDAKRRSLHRGYDVMRDDLQQRKAIKTMVDPSKGGGMQAMGGTLMNVGMSGLGGQAGSYFGKSAGNAGILNNLF